MVRPVPAIAVEVRLLVAREAVRTRFLAQTEEYVDEDADIDEPASTDEDSS